MRLIDADKLANLLENDLQSFEEMISEHGKGLAHGTRIALGLVKEQPTITQESLQPQWIPFTWRKTTKEDGWSDWNKPGEQAHWCRGGVCYPATHCLHYVKYIECTVKECLKATVQVFQDGYIDCSLIENYGCEKCMEEWERKQEENT